MVALLDLPPVPKDQPVTGERLTSILRRITHAFKSPGPVRKTVKRVNANYTALPSDAYIYVDTLFGPVTVTLPLASTMLNAELTVKIVSGLNGVTVQRTAPDNLQTASIIAGGSITWNVVGDSYTFISAVDGTQGHWDATANFSSVSGGAPTGSAFVTIGNDAALSAERALAVTTDLTLADGGPNASVTLGLATVSAAKGGTGQAGGYAVGDLLYASAASTIAKLAAVAAGFILKSAGVTTAPVWGSLVTARLTADNAAIAAATPTTGVAVAGLQQAVNVNEEWDVEWILYVANSIAADVFVINVVPTAGTFTGRVRVEGVNGVPTAGAGVVKFLDGPAGTITTATANAPGNTGTIGLVTTIRVRAQGKQTVSNGTLTVQLRAGTNAAASSGTATVKLQSQMTALRIV